MYSKQTHTSVRISNLLEQEEFCRVGIDLLCQDTLKRSSVDNAEGLLELPLSITFDGSFEDPHNVRINIDNYGEAISVPLHVQLTPGQMQELQYAQDNQSLSDHSLSGIDRDYLIYQHLKSGTVDEKLAAYAIEALKLAEAGIARDQDYPASYFEAQTKGVTIALSLLLERDDIVERHIERFEELVDLSSHCTHILTRDFMEAPLLAAIVTDNSKYIQFFSEQLGTLLENTMQTAQGVYLSPALSHLLKNGEFKTLEMILFDYFPDKECLIGLQRLSQALNTIDGMEATEFVASLFNRYENLHIHSSTSDDVMAFNRSKAILLARSGKLSEAEEYLNTLEFSDEYDQFSAPYAEIAAATLSYWSSDRDMGIGFARSVLNNLIEKSNGLASKEKDRVLSCFIYQLSKHTLSAPELIQDALSTIESSEDIIRNCMYLSAHQLESGSTTAYSASFALLRNIYASITDPKQSFVTAFCTLRETTKHLSKENQKQLATDLTNALEERAEESIGDDLLGFAAETLYELDLHVPADRLYAKIKNAGMGRKRALRTKGMAEARLGESLSAQESFRNACEQIAPKLLQDQLDLDRFRDECNELREQGETHVSALGFEFPLDQLFRSEESIDLKYAQEFANVARDAITVAEADIANECLDAALVAARKGPKTHTATAAASITGELFLGVTAKLQLR